jgi:hypothetical protein
MGQPRRTAQIESYGTRTVSTALRISPRELQEIDDRAQAAGMSRSDYMIRSSLGLEERKLGDVTLARDVIERVAALEERCDVFERMVQAHLGILPEGA